MTPRPFPATIYHNPACGTSRNALAALLEAGAQVEVVEYLKAGWTRPQLDGLLRRMNARPRDLLRTKQALASELGLIDGAGDDAILDAMVAHPVLVERPIVVTPKGAALCRPVDRLQALLPL